MANPTLNENTFESSRVYIAENEVMTVKGTIFKTAFLLLITFLAAAVSWKYLKAENMQLVKLFTIGGGIGGLITALIICFKQKTAPILAPVYALFEGLLLGCLSAMFNIMIPGIVVQAVLGTFATAFTMLALYLSRAIVVTEKLRSIIFAATLTAVIYYAILAIYQLFTGVYLESTFSIPVQIGITLIIIVIAAFNLLNDFDIIERGANACAPKFFEWYCSFGVLVTLIWLYIEILKILRLFSKR